ncbi:MAG: hypothetical protein WBE10_02605 [Candidatus Acidiferrum sp.]
MRNSEETPLPLGKIWSSFRWCLQTLLGFLTFLFAFPIDRRIPFWPHLNLAEILALWFLFITPVTTVFAIVTLMKHKRTQRLPVFGKLLVWTAIAASVVVNLFVLVGMWASTY